MTDVVIAVLKYLFVFLQGLFGWHAVQAANRDEDGRLTRAGKVAAFPIVVFMLLSIVLFSFELLRQREEGRAAVAESEREAERIAAAADRGIFQLRHVRLSFSLRYPCGAAGLRAYEERVSQSVAELTKAYQHDGSVPKGVGFSMSPQAGLQSLSLDPGSRLAPDPQKDWLASLMLLHTSASLTFFREPGSKDDNPLAGHTPGRRPDLLLRFSVVTRRDAPPMGVLRPIYDPKGCAFVVRAFELPAEDGNVIATGRVIGISDLVGTQLWFAVGRWRVPDRVSQQALDDAYDRYQLDWLLLSFPGGRTLDLTNGLERAVDSEDQPLYHYTFPTTQAGLLKLQ